MSVYDKFRQESKLVINPKKLNCVFMSFYSYISVDSKKNKIPAVLLQMRREGVIGFPGGKVEIEDHQGNLNEYTLKKALIRELKEEINLQMELDFDKFQHLSTFSSKDLFIHNFSYRLTEDEFLELFSNSNKPLNIAENAGCIICYLHNFGGGRGLRNFMGNSFKATSLAELQLLNERLNPNNKKVI